MLKPYYEIRRSLSFFRSYIGSARIIPQSTGDLIICFHGFGSRWLKGNSLYKATVYELKYTLYIIRKYFSIVTLEELLHESKKNNRQNRLAAITMDDGYSSILNIMDIFYSVNVIPSVFICPNLIDNCSVPFPEIIRASVFSSSKVILNCQFLNKSISLWRNNEKRRAISILIEIFKNYYGNKLKENLCILLYDLEVSNEQIQSHEIYDPLLSWNQIDSLSGDIHIGSHTLNHYHLSTISDAAAGQEILNSKQIIEKRIGRSCDIFCYPFGNQNSFSTREIELIRGADYNYSVTLEPSFISNKCGKFEIPRFNGLRHLCKSFK
ncbi:polysaccharide deacetylase family protein [candidate division KSB1 bacterium]|nr:polysaccharide deacetylase family protein [candidate division KSB1 bacterium]